MKFKKDSIYSLILSALVLLVIYQTQRLWFDQQSNYNLFSDSISYNSSYSISSGNYITKPSRMIAFYPSDTYTVIRNTRKEYDNVFGMARILIKKCVETSTILKKKDISYDSLSKKQLLIFRYPYGINQYILEEELGIDKLDIGNEEIKEIILSPVNINDSDKAFRFYLVSSDNMYEFESNMQSVREENQGLLSMLDDVKDINNYVSTRHDGIQLFSDEVFIPKDSVSFMPLNLTKPFTDESNGLNYYEVRKYLKKFFTNPNLVFEDNVDGNIVLSSDKVTIKYNNVGIVEYSEQPDYYKTATINVSNAYNIACNFLSLDEQLSINNGEYYLTNFKKGEDDTYHFYFNYRFDDFDYIMSEELSTAYNMNYPMEITVKGYKVTYYKRILLEKAFNTKQRHSTLTYIQALDTFYNYYSDIKNLKLTDMYLAYYHKIGESDIKVIWIIETEDRRYPINTN